MPHRARGEDGTVWPQANSSIAEPLMDVNHVASAVVYMAIFRSATCSS
jgi:hypothetical protein